MTPGEEVPDDEGRAPEPEATPAPDAGSTARLAWSSPELAWPISLAAGFLGTFFGLKSGFPGAPALLATAVFAPVFVRLQARRRAGTAFLSSAAWMVGIIAALVGTTVEGGGESAITAVPFAASFAAAEWGRLDGMVERSYFATMVRNCAVFWCVILLARPYVGVLSLLLVAYVIDLLGAGVGIFAERMAAESWSPSYSALLGSPPHLVLPVLGALAAASVVASPGRLLPVSSLRGERRHLLLWGTTLGLLALVCEPLLAPLWQRTLG